MALNSPGSEITVIDDSHYAQAVATSIPYILVATAQDKQSGTDAGSIATSTTKENANVVTPVSSRRELVTLFGIPEFKTDTTGSVVQGHELNEYGIQTAYSLLGVTNRVYVQRVDIDLDELQGTAVRPTDAPNDGTLWFDITDTSFGIFEWNEGDQTFNSVSPIVISDTADTSGGVPNSNIGTIGNYAVVATSASNPVYYKDRSGNWNLVGSEAWAVSRIALQATIANPVFSIGDSIDINTVSVTLTGTTVASTVIDINNAAVPGITAASWDNKLSFHVSPTLATSNGIVVDGKILLDTNVGTVTFFADAGITGGTYNTVETQLSPHTQVPEWKTADTGFRPTGSVWVKSTSPNGGADFDVNRYNASINEWTRIATPLFKDTMAANKALDSVGGGKNISAGSMYARYDTLENGTLTYAIYTRAAKGPTVVTGSVPNATFNIGDQFDIQVSQPGFVALTAVQPITISGTTANGVVTSIQNAGVQDIEASLNAAGQIEITHTAGGTIVLKNITGIPLNDMGISAVSLYVEAGNNSDFVVSNWVKSIYTASAIQPSVDPADGIYWYYSEVSDVDLMMHDGSDWKGYQNVGIDARGADLSLTNPEGPIVSASEPPTQSDGTQIELGDIWIDTSNIDSYPVMNRWTASGGGVEAWVSIDIADATSENGIVFQDARWDLDGTSDVITSDLTSIVDLLTSDYLDLDAPDAALYPRGTILWNTRRSGFNVKQFVSNYFNASSFAGALPTETNTWRTASGLKLDGSPYMGAGAVRNMIVTAMKGGIDSSLSVREESNTLNILSAVGYPELISNLTKVNVDRKETAFVIGDSPMKLPAASLALQEWAANTNLAADNGLDGLVSNDEYLGVYYPAGLSNDLTGKAVVMPSSHMALRTMIKSDNQAYPWIAAAGVRRGTVDNATSIGYIDAATGEFQSISVGEGLRDVLYTNRVNPISVLPGSGITVFGQKTRATASSSLDRINVARLTAHLRYVLALIAKPFIFEPNDKLTRDEFKNSIERYMNELVAKRAIYDYLVVVDKSNNTNARIDRNEMYADVAIEPVKAAEFIYVPLRLKNTGEI